MATVFMESGTDATQGFEFWTSTNGAGSLTSDSVIVNTGPRSIKASVTSGQAAWVAKNGVFGDAGRASGYFRLSALPTNTTMIFRVDPSSIILEIRITSAGVVTLMTNGTSMGTGSTISSATWYRFTITWNIVSTTSYTARVFLNGVQDISVSNSPALDATGNNNRFIVGVISDPGSTLVVNVDDCYGDTDGTNTDPGNIKVTAKLPAANNTNNWNTAVGANPANRWENVNERPLSETNGWEETGSTGTQENYGLETAATGDVDVSAATLIARCAWIWAKISVASVQAKIMDNGTESAVTLTTTSALYTLITDSASYPSNAAGIGARSSTTANTFLYECGTLIAYIPGGAAAAQPVGQGFLLAGYRNSVIQRV